MPTNAATRRYQLTIASKMNQYNAKSYAKNTAKRRAKGYAWEINNPMNRRAITLRRHGLTIEEYDIMLADQNGLCNICLDPPKDGKRLNVDHDHATNKIRALLCDRCNRALGMFKDDAMLIPKAVAYLIKHSKV